MSRNMAQPAGAGAVVDSFIQSGSSSSVGMRAREFCVPGICGAAAPWCGSSGDVVWLQW